MMMFMPRCMPYIVNRSSATDVEAIYEYAPPWRDEGVYQASP